MRKIRFKIHSIFKVIIVYVFMMVTVSCSNKNIEKKYENIKSNQMNVQEDNYEIIKENGVTWIGPTNEVDINGLSVFWQYENRSNSDAFEELKLLVSTKYDEEGYNVGYNNTEKWALIYEKDNESFVLIPPTYFDKENDYTAISCDVLYNQNSLVEPFSIIVTIATGEILNYIWNEEKEQFRVERIYNIEDFDIENVDINNMNVIKNQVLSLDGLYEVYLKYGLFEGVEGFKKVTLYSSTNPKIFGSDLENDAYIIFSENKKEYKLLDLQNVKLNQIYFNSVENNDFEIYSIIVKYVEEEKFYIKNFIWDNENSCFYEDIIYENNNFSYLAGSNEEIAEIEYSHNAVNLDGFVNVDINDDGVVDKVSFFTSSRRDYGWDLGAITRINDELYQVWFNTSGSIGYAKEFVENNNTYLQITVPIDVVTDSIEEYKLDFVNDELNLERVN